MNKFTSSLALLLALLFVACGGGGGGGTSSGLGGNTSGSVSTPPIKITTDQYLPGALTGQPYSITLLAGNVTGAQKWIMGPASTTGQYVTGLTLDPATGVLSGVPTFQGTASFVATVSDASALNASQIFYVTAYGAMTTPAPISLSASQFGYAYGSINVQGGVPPLKYSVSSGSLPLGVSIDGNGNISGSPLKVGTYNATVTVQDSWKPPQSTTQLVNYTVTAAYLMLNSRIGIHSLVLNAPYEGAFYAAGGVPPYTFQVTNGNLPAGLTLDANTGKVSGTPTTLGYTSGYVQVTDSAGTKSTAYAGVQVVKGHGRNDSVQSATPFSTVSSLASLSPYIDPPDKAPTPADTDYYSIQSMAGSVVNLSTNGYGAGPIDTVIEVLDANGIRQTTCHLPDDPAGVYTSSCINDEASSTTHNSALDFSVPGTAPAIVTFYLHVLDWRGDARPDMQYAVGVNGIKLPYNITFYAVRGAPYTNDLTRFESTSGASTWTLVSGTLPDGLTLSSAGTLSGTPTTNGTSLSVVKLVDSATPPQTNYMNLTMIVSDPLTITSPAVMTTACSGKPYSFTVQAAGGNPPLYFNYYSPSWPSLGLNPFTGVFSGTPMTLGTFTARVYVNDIANNSANQDVTLTVQNCP